MKFIVPGIIIFFATSTQPSYQKKETEVKFKFNIKLLTQSSSVITIHVH